jgi:hypothetical protein
MTALVPAMPRNLREVEGVSRWRHTKKDAGSNVTAFAHPVLLTKDSLSRMTSEGSGPCGSTVALVTMMPIGTLGDRALYRKALNREGNLSLAKIRSGLELPFFAAFFCKQSVQHTNGEQINRQCWLLLEVAGLYVAYLLQFGKRKRVNR